MCCVVCCVRVFFCDVSAEREGSTARACAVRASLLLVDWKAMQLLIVFSKTYLGTLFLEKYSHAGSFLLGETVQHRLGGAVLPAEQTREEMKERLDG